jgi:hypothetical protein
MSPTFCSADYNRRRCRFSGAYLFVGWSEDENSNGYCMSAFCRHAHDSFRLVIWVGEVCGEFAHKAHKNAED